MLNNYPDVLTVAQLAEILGVCKNAAYRLIQSRAIGCRRVGRSIRVPKVCVIDYLNSARYTTLQP